MQSRAVAHDSLIATAGQIVQGVARLGYTVAIARSFGPALFGDTSKLIAVGLVLSLFWPTGAALVVSRHLARLDSDPRAPDSTRALTRQFGMSLLILAPVDLLIGWYATDRIGLALWGAAFFATYSAWAFTRAVSLGKSRVRIAFAWDVVSAAVAICGLIGVIALDEPSLVLLPMTVGYGLFALVLWPKTAAVTEPRWNDRALVRSVSANSIAQVTTNGMLSLAMVAAGFFGDTVSTAHFAAAFAIATPASMLGQSLQQVLVPHFSRVELRIPMAAVQRNEILRVVGVAVGTIIVAFTVVGFGARLIMNLLYKPDYLDAVDQMRFLLIGVAIFSISLIPAALLIAANYTRVLVRANIYGFVLGVGLMAALGASLGTWASVVGYGSGAVVSTVFTFAAFRKLVSPISAIKINQNGSTD